MRATPISLLFFLITHAAFSIQQKTDNFITIHDAHLSDLEQLISLDRRVSFDYFKPIYTNGYAHLELGKNPDYFLEQERETPRSKLRSILRHEENRRITRQASGNCTLSV